MMRKCAVLTVGVVLSLAGTAAGQAVRVHTTAAGTFLRASDGQRPSGGGLAGADALAWTYNHPTAIAESVALSPASDSAWVGQTLNFERLQRFAISGSGIPSFEVLAGSTSPSIVAAAKSADVAVFLDKPDAPAPNTLYQVKAYRAGSAEPTWTREFPATYDGYVGAYQLRVSRDGSTVAVALNQAANFGIVYFLDGVTGAIRQSWPAETGAIGSVDLSDNGGLCFLQHTTNAAYGRLINTSTGLEVFSTVGSGSGSRYQLSGDGSVLVMGGFSFHVWKLNAGVYTRIINFTAPTSWFGWGSAVSRDGSTVAAMSHNYGASYLNTDTRIWDVATTALLGTYPTAGSGAYQDSIVGAALSENGSRLAVASWGVQIEGHQEVMVFDRNVNLIDQHDTPGSPFSIDMSADGRYVLVGSKSVHANVFGNGGNTYLLDLGGSPGGCYPNCDNSTAAPVLNVQDFTCFLQRYAAGDTYANCDASTTAPVLNVQDFTCFLQRYAGGCP
jgi:WD40 repeat protein